MLKEYMPSLGGTAILSIILGLASLALFIMHVSGGPEVSSNEIAQQETQKNHDQYVNWALHHLKNNELKRAKYFIEKARVINPDGLVIQEVLASLDKKNKSVTENKIDETNIISSTEKSYSEGAVTTDELLTRAKHQVLSKNLTSPPNNNAFATYKMILKIEPENSEAITGVSEIKKSYVNWAEQDLKKNNHHRAVLFYKKALSIDPSDTKLTQLLKTLKPAQGTS
ncbi:MAG: hypothetical protein ACR2PU_03435 [Gammaproteobacteria bacterium]